MTDLRSASYQYIGNTQFDSIYSISHSAYTCIIVILFSLFSSILKLIFMPFLFPNKAICHSI